MKYYYLNPAREPQGPCTRDQLAALLAEGKITLSTEIATKGAERWIPLSELLAEEPLDAPAEIPQDSLGACPHCGKELPAADALPLHCPTCGGKLRAANSGFIACVAAAFAQYATFRGRATRAEYWWFVLLCTLIGIPFQCYFQHCGVSLENPDMPLSPAVFVVLFLYGLVQLGLLVPTLSVCVRRLHDTGRSGWWILWLYLGLFTGYGLLLASLFTDSMLLLSVAVVLLLALIGISIFLFVCLFLDSQRGPNKYGPSAKYPHA